MIKTFIGEDIPIACKKLTLRNGLMQYWIEERHLMGAAVMYQNGKPIAWCGYYKQGEGVYSIGTFVSIHHRKKGYGKKVLIRACRLLASQREHATVRYGARCSNFNDLYLKAIKKCGLIPDWWY